MRRIRSRAPASGGRAWRWGGAALLSLGALAAACGESASPPAPPAAGAPASYVGYWRWSGNQNGIGSILRLYADGKAELSLCVMLDGTYTLDGARLERVVVEPQDEPGPQGGMTQVTVEVRAETMVQTAGEQTLVMQRRGALAATAGPTDIVGVWSYPHYAGGTAFERYDPGGAWSMRLPMVMPRQPATWTTMAAGLRLERGSGALTEYVAQQGPAGWRLVGPQGAGAFSWLGETLWHPTTQE